MTHGPTATSRSFAIVALVALAAAVVHLLGPLADDAGHHAGHHGGHAAAAVDQHDPHQAPAASEEHPDEETVGVCGYASAAGPVGAAACDAGVDPSGLVADPLRRLGIEQPPVGSRTSTPHLVRELQVMRV